MSTIALPREQAGADWLFRAAVRGDRAAVESALLAGANPDDQDDDGDTPLVLAAAAGRSAIAELLLDAGADVNLAGRDGMTPLIMASLSGHHAVVELVIARGPRVDVRDALGRTALWFAALASDLDLARRLRVAGADPLLADLEGWSPLDLAIEVGERPMIRLLAADRPVAARP
jgi:ankyrin repeat protein